MIYHKNYVWKQKKTGNYYGKKFDADNYTDIFEIKKLGSKYIISNDRQIRFPAEMEGKKIRLRVEVLK